MASDYYVPVFDSTAYGDASVNSYGQVAPAQANSFVPVVNPQSPGDLTPQAALGGVTGVHGIHLTSGRRLLVISFMYYIVYIICMDVAFLPFAAYVTLHRASHIILLFVCAAQDRQGVLKLKINHEILSEHVTISGHARLDVE